MSEDQKTPKNYALNGAIIFGSVHAFIIILLLLWSLQASIFSTSGGNFLLFLLEWPGVVLTKVLGQAGDLEAVVPYIITFFTNTLVYAAIGFGLGHLFHKKGWIDELENTFLTEEEVLHKEEKV